MEAQKVAERWRDPSRMQVRQVVDLTPGKWFLNKFEDHMKYDLKSLLEPFGSRKGPCKHIYDLLFACLSVYGPRVYRQNHIDTNI